MLLFCLKFEFNGLVFRVSVLSHSDRAGTLVMSFRGTRKNIDFYLQGCVPFRKKFIISSFCAFSSADFWLLAHWFIDRLRPIWCLKEFSRRTSPLGRFGNPLPPQGLHVVFECIPLTPSLTRKPEEVLASTTGTETTTPQIKNLIGRVKKNNRAARATRTFEQVRAVLCKTAT